MWAENQYFEGCYLNLPKILKEENTKNRTAN